MMVRTRASGVTYWEEQIRPGTTVTDADILRMYEQTVGPTKVLHMLVLSDCLLCLDSRDTARTYDRTLDQAISSMRRENLIRSGLPLWRWYARSTYITMMAEYDLERNRYFVMLKGDTEYAKLI